MNLGLKSLIDPVFCAVERVRPTLSNGLFSQPVPPRHGDVTSSETSGVSVIIPAHNAEETLEATLDSVARQTHAVWEALVVNDGSTDATLATVESWVDRDPRFRLP
jgi:cellulose synthase/poly-beta-1,6-N-acetylglucosamine synthase-like glycosyltransferase